MYEQLEEFIETNISKSSDVLDRNWESIKRSSNTIVQSKLFPIDNPKTSFLVELYKLSPEHYTGGYSFFFKERNFDISTPKQLTGALMAYEFQFEDTTKLPKRRNAERSSNSLIRSNFEKAFEESSNKVNSFLQKANRTSNTHSKKVLKLIDEKQTAYDDWFQLSKENEELHSQNSLARAKQLEDLYAAKLQISMPAKYWEDRAADMKIEGDKWRKWFIGSIVIGVIVLVVILGFLSNSTIENLFSSTGSAIRFSVLFVTLFSLLVYGVRSFAKLMFSSYHLRRDAQERKQLAYFYLALMEHKGVQDADRHLIIQSLFSRADSGLLRDDSSPAMPSSIVMDKIISGR